MFIIVGCNSNVHFKIRTIKGHKYLYVIKNERIDGKVVQTVQKYIGSADQVYQLATSIKPTHIASYSFGKPAAFLKAAEEVGLVKSLNKHLNTNNKEGLTPAEYLLLIIIGRSEHALSRNVLAEYFNKSSLQFIWNPKHKLSSQNFLNYMKRLDEETIQQIELDVSRTLLKKDIKPTRLIFDTTNFYTHIEHGEDLPQKSLSKEKRYDKNLIGVGLTVSDHDIPFHSVTYPANKSDSALFPEIIESICDRLKSISIPTEDITIIFDRGMNSAPNLEKISGKMHVVGSLPSSMCKTYFKILVSEYNETWINSSGHMIKGHHVSGNWYGQDLIGAIRYNERTKRKQMHEWKNNKPKIFEKIEDIKAKLSRKGRGRKLTEKGLITRVVEAIPKQYRGLFDYNVVKMEGELKLEFNLIEAREHDFINGMGKTVIFTDITGLTAQNISEMYDARNRIETDIKWLKDKLLIPLRPIFVRKDVNIRAHVFLCVMGLLLYKYILYIIEDDNLSLTKLAESLDQMRLGLIHDGKDDKEKRKNAKFVIEDMSKDTAKIFSSLNLDKYIPN